MTHELNFYAKSPNECTESELKSFYSLVVKGGKVATEGLEDRIVNCEVLAFCTANSLIVGVSAIKKPSKSYREGVVKKSQIMRKWSELTFEIGYSFTEPEYRKRGISSELKQRLLQQMTTRKGILFSTTAITSSQKFLANNGFNTSGVAYDGDNDKGIRYYEKVL